MDSSGSRPSSSCLWCAAPLTLTAEQVTRCEQCGRGNRRQDLAKYRTLSPRLRRLQTALEVGAALTLGACLLASMINWRHLKGGDPSVVWAIIGPALMALAVGYWSRFITERRIARRFRPNPLACGGPLLVVGAYFTILALTQRDLEGFPLEVALVVASAIVGAMVLRVWRASRRAT